MPRLPAPSRALTWRVRVRSRWTWSSASASQASSSCDAISSKNATNPGELNAPACSAWIRRRERNDSRNRPMTSAARSRISSGLRIDRPRPCARPRRRRRRWRRAPARRRGWRWRPRRSPGGSGSPPRSPSGLGTTRRTTSSMNRSPRLMAGYSRSRPRSATRVGSGAGSASSVEVPVCEEQARPHCAGPVPRSAPGPRRSPGRGCRRRPAHGRAGRAAGAPAGRSAVSGSSGSTTPVRLADRRIVGGELAEERDDDAGRAAPGHLADQRPVEGEGVIGGRRGEALVHDHDAARPQRVQDRSVRA